MLIRSLTIFTLVFSCVAAQAAPVVTFENPGGGDFRLDAITGLEINGTIYDVDFLHGGAYDSDFTLFAASLGVSPIVFNTVTTANQAANAIVNSVNALNVDASSFTHLPGTVRVPRQHISSIIRISQSTRVDEDPLSFGPAGGGVTSSLTAFPSGGTTTTEWAAFSIATSVPEPSSFAWFSGMVGFLGIRRRRKIDRTRNGS